MGDDFAVDLAFGYFLAMVVFHRHPVVPFFLLIALSSNVLGFAALAPAAMAEQLQPEMLVVGMAAAWRRARTPAERRAKLLAVRPRRRRAVVAGAVLGGIHPALALVPIVPFMPHAARDPGFLVDAPAAEHDMLNEFERWCRHPAQVALLLFGLVTGGVLSAPSTTAHSRCRPRCSSASRSDCSPASCSHERSACTCPSTSAGASSSSSDPGDDRLHDGTLLRHRLGRSGRGTVRAQVGALLTLGGGLLAFIAALVLRVGRFAHRHAK